MPPLDENRRGSGPVMLIKRRLLIAAAGVLLALQWPLPVRATNDCITYPSLAKEYATAASVFVGRVRSVEYIPGRECCHVLSGYATLDVVRWWKGQLPKQVRIGAVGQIFKVDTEYVVFAFGPTLVADNCNSTQPTNTAARTLSWLNDKPSRRPG